MFEKRKLLKKVKEAFEKYKDLESYYSYDAIPNVSYTPLETLETLNEYNKIKGKEKYYTENAQFEILQLAWNPPYRLDELISKHNKIGETLQKAKSARENENSLRKKAAALLGKQKVNGFSSVDVLSYFIRKYNELSIKNLNTDGLKKLLLLLNTHNELFLIERSCYKKVYDIEYEIRKCPEASTELPVLQQNFELAQKELKAREEEAQKRVDVLFPGKTEKMCLELKSLFEK